MIDIFILIFGIVSILLFFFIGISKIFNFYLGLIFGLFIYISINQNLKLLSYIEDKDFAYLENILFSNSQIFVSISILFIIIFGILFSSIACKGDKNTIISSLYGFIFPFFIVGTISFISNTLYINLFFVDFLINILSSSKIFLFFSQNTNNYYFLIFFMIFGKFFYYFGKFFYIFIKWFSKKFYIWFINKKEEKS